MAAGAHHPIVDDPTSRRLPGRHRPLTLLERHPERVDAYTLAGTLYLPLHIAPGSGVRAPKHGWATVTGHFDDPASRQCRGIAKRLEPRPVAACRASFVVTRIRRLPRPPAQP